MHPLDDLDGAISAMTMRLYPIMLLLLAAAGCSSASTGASLAGGGGKGGLGGSAGSMSGSGGSPVVIIMDAGAAAADAAARRDGEAGQSQVPSNLATDAPVFVWDWDARACQGCNTDAGGVGGAASGGSGGARNSGGTAGTGTKTGLGGSTASGSGGSSARGGSSGSSSTGSGGSMAGGAAGGNGGSGSGGYAADASVGGDARPLSSDAGAADTVVAPDMGGLRDLGAGPEASSDVRGADGFAPDNTTRCEVKIRGIAPVTDALDQVPLVAGTNAQVVLRAELISGGPAAPVWTWQASRDGMSVPAASYGQKDRAAVAFPIASDGNYTFTVLEQSSPLCSATVRAAVVPANACPACDRSVILRAAPPPAADIPVQSGAIGLINSSPFGDNDVVLAKGVRVLVSPSVGGSKVPSYVRVNSVLGELVIDGYADPKAGFGARLLDMDNNLALLRYDVLVVPIDGANGSTYAATAPQLFQNYTPDQINAAGFFLSGGATVTGSTTTRGGQNVADARVILTNRNPTATAQPSDLIFSSVGRADAAGNYVLHAQPGQYWVSISPPSGSGLAEALAPSAIELGVGTTTISFQWNAPSMAELILNVRDARGAPLDGAQVRLTSAQATTVGTLSVSGAAASGSQEAIGNVRAEGTTAGGVVAFANLPAGVAYDVLIVPATLGPASATTEVTVTVPAGGTTQTVQLLAQDRIFGNLLAGASPDWSQVQLVAYDRSADSPESPQTASVNPDGSFSIGVSPGRPYVVLAVPAAGSGLARTFVGPGALEASEFGITQRVQASMDWIATVMDQNRNGLEGTALQVFCGPSWPNCIDATIPLAETTSESGGVFQLALPDPSTR
jgi:hypothetical protein